MRDMDPKNILDSECLKPGSVEKCRCVERDAAHSQNAEGCVLGKYSSRREIWNSKADHYWKDGSKTRNWSKTTFMDEKSLPVDWDQRPRGDVSLSRGWRSMWRVQRRRWSPTRLVVFGTLRRIRRKSLKFSNRFSKILKNLISMKKLPARDQIRNKN